MNDLKNWPSEELQNVSEGEDPRSIISESDTHSVTRLYYFRNLAEGGNSENISPKNVIQTIFTKSSFSMLEENKDNKNRMYATSMQRNYLLQLLSYSKVIL